MTQNRTFIVQGTHGELVVCAATGRILTCNCEEYSNILSFDVREWHEAYPREAAADGRHDILDWGYWIKGGGYEPPAQDWRDEFRDDLPTPHQRAVAWSISE